MNLRGAKKDGGGGSEAADSLRSTQIAEVLDLISEGEVEGLVHGLRSIYLDGVPLENADGTMNFKSVQVQLTPGTQGQASITGADGVESVVPVALAVTATTPITKSVTNAAVDQVRVTIEVAQLTAQDPDNGNLNGSSFDWAIDVQSAGGGFVTVLTDTVDGKTTSRYTRSKQFKLPGSAPWDIRVRRVSADSTTLATVNAFSWSSYTEIRSLKLRYPNSVLARLRIDASQFSRIPTRAYDLAGMRVRVPVNYNPITKVYTGVWDGTFKVAWTDCPAWVFYDLVTSSRYGLGRYFATTAGLKWQLYTIGRYCDEMVADGKGGQEPRFRCGLYLTTREQAYKVLQDLAAIFRGITYWASSDMAVVQDAPADPVAHFTKANAVGGRFTYGGASFAKRHSQVVVWFNSLNDLGKLVPEVVVDRALQRRIGVKSLELSPLGVWSRGQAQRLGKWVLYSEQYEGQTVAFRVGMDGVLVAPGQIFTVADVDEAGERIGGRIHSATTSTVQLDAPVTLAAGETYTLGVMLQDPADAARLVTQRRQVTTAAGTHSALTVSPAFTSAPAAEGVWVLESTGLQTTSWRCVSVREVADSNEYEISGIRHHAGKYALIEQGIALAPGTVSRIQRVPPAVASLAFTETVYSVADDRRSRVTVSWPEPAPGLSYLASWRLNAGPWTDMPATNANAVDVDGLAPGELDVSVRSRNALGNLSPPRADVFTVTGVAVALRLQADLPAFIFDSNGAPSPAAQTITVTAQLTSLVGPPTMTCTRYDAAGAALGTATLGGTGNKRTLAVAAFGAAAYAVVQATLVNAAGTLTATLKVGRVAGGSGVYALAITIFKQAGAVPPAPSGGSYTFTGDVFVPPTGWSRSMPTSSTMPTWATTFLFVTTKPTVPVPGPQSGSVLAAEDFSGGLAGYASVSGPSSPFSLVTGGPYGDALRVEGVSGVGGAVYGRTLSAASSSDVRFKFMLEALNSDDGGLVYFKDSGATVIVFNPAREDPPDALRRARLTVDGKTYIVSTAPLSIGAWYELELLTDPVGAGACTIRELATGAVAWVTAIDPAPIAPINQLHFSVDQSVTTMASTAQYADIRVYDASVGGWPTPVKVYQDGAAGSMLTLLATAQTFTYDSAGVAVPAAQTITFTASPTGGLTGTAAFTATLYSAAGSSLGTVALGGTGNTRTLTSAQFGSAQVCVVIATLSGFSDQVSVVRLKDGAGSVVGLLTNESATVSADNAGVVATFAGAGGIFMVFDGLTEVTGAPVTYSVAGAPVDVTITINAAGAYWVSGMGADDDGYATLRAVYKGVTIDKLYNITKSRAGDQGQSTAVLQLSAENAVLYADATGFVGSYAPAVIDITVLLGDVDDTASWALSKIDGPGVTSHINGRTLAVSSITSNSVYVTISASKAGYATLSKVFAVTKVRSAGTTSGAIDDLAFYAQNYMGPTGVTWVGIKFRPDGSVVADASPYSYDAGQWYVPLTSGIGSSHWIRVTQTSLGPAPGFAYTVGTPPTVSGPLGTITALSADVQWRFDGPANPPSLESGGNLLLAYELFSDAAGATKVAEGTMQLVLYPWNDFDGGGGD